MGPEDSSPCSKQPTTWPVLSQVNHSPNFRSYFLKNNFNVIFTSAPRFYRWAPSSKVPNQHALCNSLLLVCDIRKCFHPPVTSSVSDQNIFLTPFSKNFNFCSTGNIGGQVSHPYASGEIIVLSWKGHPNKIVISLICRQNKNDVQKLNTSNCNSTFCVFSVFNAQTVRHVLMTLAIFSVHLRQMY